ncbi:MAG TPA: hypothetical protein VFD92_23605 [Candidatus Binatia bacterium]|nr:hypothetical protein [Candidatus Binatia bacterium]
MAEAPAGDRTRAEDGASGGAPELSVVLVTDGDDTIRPVVERLHRQTARDRLEVLLVAPAGARAGVGFRDAARDFARLTVLEVESIAPLAAARAAGIRAASAPLVFVGETHTFPHPGWAAALLAAHRGPWVAVAPGFGNANPKGALSWAGFLSDYGRWVAGLPAGEIPEVPLYNASYRRSALLDLGDRLVPALSHGDELPIRLRAAGHRVYFEPTARIDHANVARPRAWLDERFASGVLIGSHRARTWSALRRVAYVAGAALIPVVLVARVLPGVRRTARHARLPAGTLTAIVVGAIVKAAGELVGYAGGRTESPEMRMHEYEVHKLAYVAR